jgi:hypothetical protein
MISSVAIALIWDQVFYRALPGIAAFLGSTEVFKSPLGDRNMALYAVLFVHLWQSLALPTVIFLAGMQSIPAELYESAVIDGSMFKPVPLRNAALPCADHHGERHSGVKERHHGFRLRFRAHGRRACALHHAYRYQNLSGCFGDTPNFCVPTPKRCCCSWLSRCFRGAADGILPKRVNKI